MIAHILLAGFLLLICGALIAGCGWWLYCKFCDWLLS